MGEIDADIDDHAEANDHAQARAPHVSAQADDHDHADYLGCVHRQGFHTTRALQ